MSTDKARGRGTEAALRKAAVQRERERAADCVPTNWCDPLLTGQGAVLPPCGQPITPRHIEALLRGIQDRIRKP